jgi:hypothetical protein
MDLAGLKIAFPFRAPDPSNVAAAEKKTEYVYEPTLWDRIMTSGPAAWVEQKLIKTDNTLQTAGGIAGTVAAVNSGLRWGLILAGLLLALFVIVEFKNATR